MVAFLDDFEVAEEKREAFNEVGSNWDHNAPHVWVGVNSKAKGKDVPPLAEVCCDNDVGFKVIGENASGGLWRSADA